MIAKKNKINKNKIKIKNKTGEKAKAALLKAKDLQEKWKTSGGRPRGGRQRRNYNEFRAVSSKSLTYFSPLFFFFYDYLNCGTQTILKKKINLNCGTQTTLKKINLNCGTQITLKKKNLNCGTKTILKKKSVTQTI